MSKKRWSVLALALGALVLGVLVGLMTVGTVAADPTPGVKIQIPRIDLWIDYDEDGEVGADEIWETWIQVQNVGTVDTGAIFLGWGEYSGKCPTNDPGPIVHYCALIRENALWTLKGQISVTVKSGIIYTVRAELYQEACQAAEETEGDTEAWRCWLEEWQFGTCPVEDDFDEDERPAGGGWAPVGGAQGEEVAVTVNRAGLNAYGTFVSSTYTGISEEMEGEDPPYEYYAPYVMKGYNGLDTELTIQNSGEVCTSVWINYMEQGSCQIVYMQHIEQLAPGEAIRVRVPCDVGQIPCFWLGSAHIAAESPLGIIVDETSFDEPCIGVDRGTLLTHRARPKVELRDGVEMLDYKVYADLIFREWSGWDASIQVQNLSRTGQHTFVTVDFMDNSGDEILFLADWVCAGGSTTFYLPIVTDLGADYIGAAEIQSHDQIDFPGGETPAQPIFAVVDLKRPDDPLTSAMDAQGGSYNAHPYSQKEWVDEIALPFMAKDAQDMYTPWTSMIAIRNNSNCNKIKPKIWFKDQTGTLLCELDSFWLGPKHVKLIDLNNIGCLYPGYVGAAKVIIEPEDVEQLCDADNDGHADNLPIMPSVIVVEKGNYGGPIDEGDITKIYEGIPYSTGDKLCDADLLGTVIDSQTLEPIQGATVTVPDGWAEYEYDPLTMRWVYTYMDATGTTGPGGMYEIEEIVTFGTLEPEPGTCYTVTVEAAEYYSSTIPNVCLNCGEDQVLDVELDPECDVTWVSGFVEDKMTGEYINGATVRANNCVILDDIVTYPDGYVETTTYSHPVYGDGYYELELPFDPECTTWVWAFAEDYNSSYDSVFIPICDEAAIDFQLRQTPKAKVLLYYGNGGVGDPTLGSTDPVSYTHLAAYLDSLGKTTVYTDVWPNQFDWTTKYELIVLLGPGHDSWDPTNPALAATGYEDLAVDGFTWGQKADLDFFLQQDGKLVVLSDATSFTGNGVENDLLQDLPVELSFDEHDLQDGHGDQITAHCLTTNVQVYSTADSALPDNWTDVTAGALAAPGNLILQNAAAIHGPNEPMYAADIPSHGNGWVIVLGDMHGLSDGAWMSNWNWSADNEWVAYNWLNCDP